MCKKKNSNSPKTCLTLKYILNKKLNGFKKFQNS